MQLNRFLSLLSGDGPRRRSDGKTTAQLARLSEHHLRDIGYVRERTVAPRSHILWM